MKTEQLINCLTEPEKRNMALQFLYDFEGMLDNDMVSELAIIITEPDTIDDTHAFSTLLAELDFEGYINPLIKSISQADPYKTPWLADYMYALIKLLDELESYWPVDENFVHLLGNWLITTDGGEISWKSSDILADIKNKASKEYLIKGAVDTALLHLTRISCLRGLVNQYQDDAHSVVKQLINDQDTQVKEAAINAQSYLTQI